MKTKQRQSRRVMSQRQKRLVPPLPEPDWFELDTTPKPLTLRFSPTAWAKLLYLRDRSDNEVGGFGISAAEDLLSVREFMIVKQEVTSTSVRFDDEAVGCFFDDQVDLSRKPEQFARIWAHCHPGDSPEPSATDEETFERVFGSCQWAVMVVIARDDSTYARLRFNVGPGGQMLIPVQIDYTEPFGPSDHEAWDAEYEANVRATDWVTGHAEMDIALAGRELAGLRLSPDLLAELEAMDPAERQLTLDELSCRPELWDDNYEEVFL